MPNKKFFLTVGTQYAYQEHPHELHPDAYVEIHARDMDSARSLAFLHFKTSWAFIYSEENFEKFREKYHPRGCQMVIQ